MLPSESSIKIKITVESSEGTMSFVNDIAVVRDIRPEAGFKKSGFVFNDKRALNLVATTGHFLADPSCIGVDGLPDEQFVANGENFYFHAFLNLAIDSICPVCGN